MGNISPKIMGKAKSQVFFQGTSSSSSTKSSPKKSNLPIFALIAVGGIALLLYMRSKSLGPSNTGTGPVLSLNAGVAPDQSTIDNLTASILAVQGQVHVPSPVPTGGASTPIVSPPSTTVPGVIPTPSSTASTIPYSISGPSSYGGGAPNPTPTGIVPTDRSTARDSSMLANLSPKEYAALAVNPATAPSTNFLAETNAWQAANVGSPVYLDQLFNRLGILTNHYQASTGGTTVVGNSNLAAAISATQAEINRVEQTGSATGTLPATRNVPIGVTTTSGGGLVQGEGVYAYASDALKAILTSAPIGAMPGTANQTVATPTTNPFASAIVTLNKYISNLSAVKNPTATQKTELATYQNRLKAYGG